MGDWTDKDEFLEDIEGCYVEAWDKRFSAQQDLNVAWGWYNVGPDGVETCFYYTLSSLQNIIEAIDYLTCAQSNDDIFFGLHYGFKYHSGAVTWESIVEAWIKDDFEGRAPTIAVIDRMRQILWDEPFYVAWAARPEIGG